MHVTRRGKHSDHSMYFTQFLYSFNLFIVRCFVWWWVYTMHFLKKRKDKENVTRIHFLFYTSYFLE